MTLRAPNAATIELFEVLAPHGIYIAQRSNQLGVVHAEDGVSIRQALRRQSRVSASEGRNGAGAGHTPPRKGPAMVSLSSTRLTPGVSSTRVRNARCWSSETTSPQSSTTPSFTATLM
jgi:hypothetical protein